MGWSWLVVPLAVMAVVAVPPVQTLAPPQAVPELAVPAAEPTPGGWTVSMSDAPSPAAAPAFEEAVAWMDGVRGPLSITQGAADIEVHWVPELRGGARLGQHFVGTPRIEVALGDGRCEEGWTPYDAQTLRRVVAHEIGHAMGLGHDNGTLMAEDLPAAYDDHCMVAKQDVRLLPFQTLWVPLRSGSDFVVSYDIRSTGTVEACVTPPGSTDIAGWGCSRGAHTAKAVPLPAGGYRMAMRCASLLGCDVHYEVATDP